jgi:hypothetical protein
LADIRWMEAGKQRNPVSYSSEAVDPAAGLLNKK